VRLLHVTDVLPGRESLQFVPPEALYRGKWVHHACHLLDVGTLDREATKASAPQWWGYVEAWEQCKREMDICVDSSEVNVGGPKFGFIGTADKCILTARGVGEVWDLKCGQPESWHGLQLAAYTHGLGFRPAVKRRTCHLSADGSCHLVEHKGKDDLRDFMAYLRVAYYEINHGLRQWPALREGEAA
jgi:hypothetical protein